MTLAIHPRPGRCAQEVEWVIPAGTLAFTGPVASAPLLDAWRTDGVIVDVDVRPDCVALTLAEGHAWRTYGADVRAVLAESLARAAEWTPVREQSRDDVLAGAVAHVLAGPTGDFIRSHGGEVEVASVKDGVVDLHFRGACEHCPALGFTLQARLERAVRALCPHLVELRSL